jgi:hypothetical protein
MVRPYKMKVRCVDYRYLVLSKSYLVLNLPVCEEFVNFSLDKNEEIPDRLRNGSGKAG